MSVAMVVKAVRTLPIIGSGSVRCMRVGRRPCLEDVELDLDRGTVRADVAEKLWRREKKERQNRGRSACRADEAPTPVGGAATSPAAPAGHQRPRLRLEEQLQIEYEDANLIVVFKPACVPVLSADDSAPWSVEDCLGCGRTQRFFLCHLMGVRESGLLLLAKNSATAAFAREALGAGEAWTRTAVGIVPGPLGKLRGALELPLVEVVSPELGALTVPGPHGGELGRHDGAASVGARYRTQWRKLCEVDAASKFFRGKACALEFQATASDGRVIRDQIRSHAAYELGRPILGDAEYAANAAAWGRARGFAAIPQHILECASSAQSLHLVHWKMRFERFDDKKTIDLTCKLPENFPRIN